MKPPLPALAAVFLSLGALAQEPERGADDARDTITLADGKVLRGRVERRNDDDEILLLERGKRRRVDNARVKSVATVRDLVREFLTERAQGDDSAAFQWQMAEWADQKQLWGMARLCAHATLARDPDHAAAHERLGHKKGAKGWMWPVRSRWMTAAKFEEYTSDIGHGLELDSESFKVVTNAGLRRGTDALFDLERLAVSLLDEYGKPLRLAEVVRPLQVTIYSDRERFPGISSERIPYFVPTPHDDRSYLYFEGTADRPTDLITVGTQHLLYRTLVGDADPGGPLERFCAWLEIGFGRWMESRFRGPAGRGEVGDPVLDPGLVVLNVRGRRYSLPNLLHLTLRDHFYTGGSLHESIGRTRNDVHWASVQSFVHFLMDDKANPGMAARLLDFLRAALGNAKGDSSRAFDRAMGRPVEDFEQPFRDWLDKQLTNVPK
jgi:hypothetical protein